MKKLHNFFLKLLVLVALIISGFVIFTCIALLIKLFI